MQNVWRVFVRDFTRILRAPKTWAIVIGLLIMPSLYAWVNIVAFWNPYGNTEDIKVAVVNLDRGAYNEMTGELNVGDQVVAQLKDNHEIGWQFLSKDDAMHQVKSGEVYAAIVMPEHFSEDLLTIVTGDFIHPELDYYTNEKANAIAPKITDAAASTVDTQINSTFVSTVAETVAEDLEQAGINTGLKLLNAKTRTLLALNDAVEEVQSAREGLSDIEASITSAESALQSTRAALSEVDSTIGEVQLAVAEAEGLVAEVQRELAAFTDSVTNAYVTGSAKLSEASSKLNGAIAKITTGAQQANGAVNAAIADVTGVIDANLRAIDRLEQLVSQLEADDPGNPAIAPLKQAIIHLNDRLTQDQQLLDHLRTLSDRTGSAITAIQAAADAINAAVSNSANSASSIRQVLMGVIPDVNSAMTSMSASAGAFSSALGAQQVLIEEAVNLLTGLEGQLEETTAALDSLDESLEGAEIGLTTLRTDVTALDSAEIWAQLSSLTGLDPERIAEFMSSPVEVKEHALFPVATYGSAMAPLFTNLSLWIGAFMLVVLLRQEVDTEGVESLTVRQAFLGRFMLVAALNVVQALIVSIGNIFIGVQMASPIAFVLTSVLIGFVFMAIIFALAISFGYVGKGIALLLVIMQIPGASGIYPIEMMPAFFQSLFPFFPFTYGIDALRETIGGFYDGYYWKYVGALLIFAVLAFILGIFFRQRLGNFARLFNEKLSDTGLFVSEDVQVLGSRRRLTQVVQALADRQTFRAKTAQRAAWFAEHHLTLRRTALLVGLVLTVVLGIFSVFFPAGKATILSLWGVLLLVVIGFLVALQYIQQNIIYAGKVGEMSDIELHEALAREELATHSSTPIVKLRAKHAAETGAEVRK
ncbi:MAG: YhgE/Pip domain-containing protein [Leucobacter sp.]